jgi:hypothetical protein
MKPGGPLAPETRAFVQLAFRDGAIDAEELWSILRQVGLFWEVLPLFRTGNPTISYALSFEEPTERLRELLGPHLDKLTPFARALVDLLLRGERGSTLSLQELEALLAKVGEGARSDKNYRLARSLCRAWFGELSPEVQVRFQAFFHGTDGTNHGVPAREDIWLEAVSDGHVDVNEMMAVAASLGANEEFEPEEVIRLWHDISKELPGTPKLTLAPAAERLARLLRQIAFEYTADWNLLQSFLRELDAEEPSSASRIVDELLGRIDYLLPARRVTELRERYHLEPDDWIREFERAHSMRKTRFPPIELPGSLHRIEHMLIHLRWWPESATELTRWGLMLALKAARGGEITADDIDALLAVADGDKDAPDLLRFARDFRNAMEDLAYGALKRFLARYGLDPSLPDGRDGQPSPTETL